MIIELTELFERDLLKLKEELIHFKSESNIWAKADGITNSAGTLVLHLAGNLNYYIGALLGNTGYVRNREEEFSLTGVSRSQLISTIEELIIVIKNTLPNVSDEQLEAIFPLEAYGKRSTAFYLMHFYGHLNYHLGQVNYLRRILEAV
jgi:hypothetical protein